jgi:COP9 signalosome complex subunit 1
MLFKNINVAVDRGDWLGVQSNVLRLRNSQFKPEDAAKNKAKMSASMGLSQLATGAYHDAATSFVSTDPSLGDNYKEVISANDVAVYGGLCSLAVMSRSDLHRVLDNQSFRSFLELEPHIRRAISFFCSSKFRQCLDILEAYRADYLLDLHLQRHVPVLYARIRTRAIQQYVIPYSRVNLNAMAKVFSPGEAVTNSDGVTNATSPFVLDLIELIEVGALDARIDLEMGVLVSKEVDPRAEVHESALESVKEYINAAHIQLLRMNILHAGLEVPAPNMGSGGGGTEGGGKLSGVEGVFSNRRATRGAKMGKTAG